MTDKREDIIARLFDVVAAIDGFQTAERNRIDFDDTQVPAVSVLEGDEESAPYRSGRNNPASTRPYIVSASPQVFIRVGGNDVGPTLNELRAAVIDAVHADSQLCALSLNGDGVFYAGMNSQLHAARSMIGAVALVFEIRYLFVPNQS